MKNVIFGYYVYKNAAFWKQIEKGFFVFIYKFKDLILVTMMTYLICIKDILEAS